VFLQLPSRGANIFWQEQYKKVLALKTRATMQTKKTA
jgi:hypothetical protein